ncbi:hypothetical protein MMC25_004879 [Agyrium rufum]|nr:hypothetical protein [Agyrium rufum]
MLSTIDPALLSSEPISRPGNAVSPPEDDHVLLQADSERDHTLSAILSFASPASKYDPTLSPILQYPDFYSAAASPIQQPFSPSFIPRRSLSQPPEDVSWKSYFPQSNDLFQATPIAAAQDFGRGGTNFIRQMRKPKHHQAHRHQPYTRRQARGREKERSPAPASIPQARAMQQQLNLDVQIDWNHLTRATSHSPSRTFAALVPVTSPKGTPYQQSAMPKPHGLAWEDQMPSFNLDGAGSALPNFHEQTNISLCLQSQLNDLEQRCRDVRGCLRSARIIEGDFGLTKMNHDAVMGIGK